MGLLLKELLVVTGEQLLFRMKLLQGTTAITNEAAARARR
jgi:hypothetical protein